MAAHPDSALGQRDGDRERPSAWVRSSRVRAGLAQRARIVLLGCRRGVRTEIAQRVGGSRPTLPSGMLAAISASRATRRQP